MKTRSIIAAALLLASLNVQSADAQFFKKLGKVAGAVLNAATDNSKSSSNNSSSRDAKGYIPGIDFKVTACEYWGEDVLLRFTVTNTTSSDILFRPYWGNSDSANATDDSNNTHSISFNIGGEEGWGYELFKTLPAGVPVKGFIVINKVSANCRTIKSVRFSGIVAPDDKSSGQNFTYSIGANAIEMPNNTNADNIFVSLPILQFNLNKIYRDKTGKNVIIDATVKNTGSNDLKVEYGDESVVYDSEGNSYKPETAINGTNISDWNGAKMPAGIPMKALITIKNVPTGIHEFSLIKQNFKCNDSGYKYYIQIKNQRF